jgi:hypothetical protein
MAPAQTKLTIHPWLDAPLYNRIRYPKWKLYLYNAAQKMGTAMDPTGAFALVALQHDWDNHPKNQIPATATVGLNAATPASIRQRPLFAMQALYTRQAQVFDRDREMYKLESERFEKLDEAETILYAAIVESLSSGPVRTINTATPVGIASLSAVQLVGLVHTLFSTPTLQDIRTVNADLLRPLLNFEDFPDHITEHVNHYESLASFNQPCANISNISKIQTFQASIQRWPQFDSVIASWEEQHPNVLTRDFLDFTTYLLTHYYNLPQDIKPRGGNAYSTRKGKGKHLKGKGRGKGKGKGKDTGKGRSLADNDNFEQPTKRPRLHERQAQSVEIAELPDDSEDTMDSDNRSQSSHKSRQSSSSNRTVLRVHGTNTPDTPETSDTNPNPAIY